MGEPRAVAQPERPDEALAGERQAVSRVGGDADGTSDGAHAVAGEVRQAEVEFTFNDAREAVGADNINLLTDDELERIAEADEGPQAQGDTVNRVHRLKALGNGIVPAVAYVFAAAIYDQLAREAASPSEAEVA